MPMIGEARLASVADAAFRSRAPSAWTAALTPSRDTSTVPSRSVRSTRMPRARRRFTVAGAGCPYVLRAPTEIKPMRGRMASRKAAVEEVRLP